MSACSPSAATKSTRACALTVQELDCRYSGPRVVRQANLRLAPGEKGALLGGNGCGKTTLLRAVAGLHGNCAGHVDVDGASPMNPVGRREVLRRVAWVPQRHPAGGFPFLVRELLASRGALEPALNAAQALGIGHLLHRPMNALSGGQRQRAYLAWALGALGFGCAQGSGAQNNSCAGLLLADEPTSALDFDGQALVADVLMAQNATMLVVTHDPAIAARFTRTFHMADGRLREGAC